MIYSLGLCLATCFSLVEGATESKGATLIKWSDFLLQKLYHYGEALNLREAMGLLPPYATFQNLCTCTDQAWAPML